MPISHHITTLHREQFSNMSFLKRFHVEGALKDKLDQLHSSLKYRKVNTLLQQRQCLVDYLIMDSSELCRHSLRIYPV